MHTKKQYWDFHVDPAVKKQVTTGAIAAYISGGLTLLAAIIVSPYFILDALLMIGLGIGVHVAKSRACAVILLGYFILSKLLQIGSGTMNAFGVVVGIGFICMFAAGVKGSYTFYKEWKQYELEQAIQSGQIAPGATSIGPPPPPYGAQAQQPQSAQPPVAPAPSSEPTVQEPKSFADKELEDEQK